MQHRFKKWIAIALSAAMSCSLCLSAFAAGLDYFTPRNEYHGQFTDIGGWYEPYVIQGYELGLIDGTPVECLTRSPLGDPTAYEIRGAVIALRKEDAAGIQIRKELS